MGVSENRATEHSILLGAGGGEHRVVLQPLTE
jgi:hypothetical protein